MTVIHSSGHQTLPAGQVAGSVLSLLFQPGCQQEVSFLNFPMGKPYFWFLALQWGKVKIESYLRYAAFRQLLVFEQISFLHGVSKVLQSSQGYALLSLLTKAILYSNMRLFRATFQPTFEKGPTNLRQETTELGGRPHCGCLQK